MFGSYRIYIELDGVIYAYEGGKLSKLTDLSEINGPGLFLSDFGDSVSRVLQVESVPKYADVMARKKLEDAGDVDQPVTLITHWRRKKQKNTTEIFFTAVPVQLYDQYMGRVEDCDEPILFFPLYTFLHKILKKYAGRNIIAVVFQHSRSVDLIIGNKKRIYFANRSMAFDESEEQVSGLWEMILTDIKTTEAENKIKVAKAILVTWIDSAEPQWRGDLGLNVVPLPEDSVQVEKHLSKSSLIHMLRKVGTSDTISGINTRLAFVGKRVLIPANIICALVCCMLFWGYAYFGAQSKTLNMDYQNLAAELSQIKQIQTAGDFKEKYSTIVSFIKGLERVYKFPCFKELVNDISYAFGDNVLVESLQAEYGKHSLLVRINAKEDIPFAEAHRDYQRSLSVLNKKGYTTLKSSFSTDIQSSRFHLELVKNSR